MAKRHAEGPYTRERTSRSYRREKEVLPATVFYTKRTLFQLKFFFLPDKIGKDAHPEYAASIMAEEPDIFMTLRKKSLLIILFSMTAFLATTLGVSRALMLSGYEELEQLLLARNVERATNAIVHRIEGLERLVLDWAPWDDTYEFAKDFNEEYIRNNLLPETLDNLDLAVFAILPYSKEPFFFREGSKKAPIDCLSFLERSREFIVERTRVHGTSGLFLENGTIGYLAAAPILRSDGSGPPRGTLGFLRVLSPEDLANIMEETLTTFELHPLPRLSDGKDAMARRLLDGETLSTSFLSETLAAGYAILRDIEDTPALLLEVTTSRAVMLQGKRTINMFLLWIAVFGLFVTGGILFLLKKTVIDRLRATRDFLESIARNGAIRERLPLSGADELTALSASVNSVLASFEDLVENLPDPLFVTDEFGALRHINREARDSLRYGKGELLGRRLASLFDGEPRRLGQHEGDSPVFEVALRRNDGSSMPVELHIQSFRLGEKELSLTAARDLTERKTLENSLKEMAWIDRTTGLANRARFLQLLDELLSSGETRFSVLLLDLDRFRNINNLVGTRNGDQVLSIVGGRIAECLSEGDASARVGGGAFAVVLKGMRDWESAAPTTRALKESVTRPLSIDGRSVFPSVSIGVLLRAEASYSSAEVIEKAEAALAKAKSKGIGHIDLFSEDDAAGTDILTAERELRHGLRNGEFELHYQPIYRMENRFLCGFEALIRWNHPKRGLVMPDGFIPLAEETGLIVDIDRWVIARACQELSLWENILPEKRGDFFISVNASGRSLSEGHFPAFVLEATEETRIAPSSLIIEITEGVLIRNHGGTAETLAGIRNAGVSIALDDFGTGYSSLQYLNSLPIDKIKIDRSFVQSMLSGDEHRRLVKGMLALAADLGMETVAEGIETDAEFQWLLEHGAVYGQGYYLGRPESADIALGKLRTAYGL